MHIEKEIIAQIKNHLTIMSSLLKSLKLSPTEVLKLNDPLWREEASINVIYATERIDLANRWLTKFNNTLKLGDSEKKQDRTPIHFPTSNGPKAIVYLEQLDILEIHLKNIIEIVGSFNRTGSHMANIVRTRIWTLLSESVIFLQMEQDSIRDHSEEERPLEVVEKTIAEKQEDINRVKKDIEANNEAVKGKKVDAELEANINEFFDNLEKKVNSARTIKQIKALTMFEPSPEFKTSDLYNIRYEKFRALVNSSIKDKHNPSPQGDKKQSSEPTKDKKN